MLEGDWHDVLPPHGPFDVLFADGGVYDGVVDLLAPGGILVKDDLTPGVPVEGDPRARAAPPRPARPPTEILVTPGIAAIVAVRV